MARPLRMEYPGAWYHVLNRGRHREKIFFSDNDYTIFMKVLGECTKLFTIEIHAYSLIPNHYHLLIHTPEANLSRSMRHLNGVYTQAINRKYKTEGSLFRGRFKSIVIEKDSYLQELVRYMHRNPYRAKLEKEIGEHKWTSHAAYMKRVPRPAWLTVEDVLIEYGGHEKAALLQFDAFVKKEVPKKLAMILRRIKWPVLLGGEIFKEGIRERLKGKKIEKSEIPQYKESMRRMPVDVAIDILENAMGYKDVFKKKKSAQHILKRRAFAYICKRYLYAPYRDTCNALGGISHSALSKQYRLARDEIQKREGCYGDFEEMVKVFKFQFKT